MKSQIKDTLLLIGSADSDRAQLHDIFESRYYLLEAENAALRTAAAAPVRAVGSSGGEGGDSFLLGFDHEEW